MPDDKILIQQQCNEIYKILLSNGGGGIKDIIQKDVWEERIK